MVLRGPRSLWFPQTLSSRPSRRDAIPLRLRMPHDQDLRLVRSALAGRSADQRELIRRMKVAHRLLVVQNRRLGQPLDEAAVEDVAQDATLSAWRKLEEYEGRASLETWVYRFCFLELMNAIRHRHRRSTLQLSAVDVPTRDDQAPVGEGLGRYLRHLSPREAEAVRLRHVEDLAFEEIATTLDVSVSSAKTHYYRAIEKLRTVVQETTP